MGGPLADDGAALGADVAHLAASVALLRSVDSRGLGGLTLPDLVA